jgi:hypothetical protein
MEDMEGLIELSDKFNFPLIIDLIKVLKKANETEQFNVEPKVITNFWTIILSILGSKVNKKQFFYGQRMGPSLKDVQLLLDQIESHLESFRASEDESLWAEMSKVLRLMTQKALNSVDDELQSHRDVLKYSFNDFEGV